MSPIDPRIHQVLDGERARETLPPDLRAELDRLEATTVLLCHAVPVPSVGARVMAEVRRRKAAGLARLGTWLTEQRAVTLRVRPIWSVMLAAAAALIALLPAYGPGPILGIHEGIVQFVGRFPGARTVEVVGSFTDWRSGALPLRDEDHDGVWHAEVVLPAGQHEYMFVVDGERWVSDPLAGRYVADGFGRENSLLIVRQAYQ
jgi:hypothetical protein